MARKVSYQKSTLLRQWNDPLLQDFLVSVLGMRTKISLYHASIRQVFPIDQQFLIPYSHSKTYPQQSIRPSKPLCLNARGSDPDFYRQSNRCRQECHIPPKTEAPTYPPDPENPDEYGRKNSHAHSTTGRGTITVPPSENELDYFGSRRAGPGDSGLAGITVAFAAAGFRSPSQCLRPERNYRQKQTGH